MPTGPQSPLEQPARATARRKWKTFAIGISIRLAGLALIWFGDGSSSLPRKTMVVVGVVLSVGGIGVLRYLLLAEPLSRLAKRKAKPATSDAIPK
jgi:hypothetical protein